MIRKKFIAIVLAIGLVFSSVSFYFPVAFASASQQVGINLANNGDFEKGNTSGWRNDGGDDSLSVVEGKYNIGDYIGQSVRDSGNAGDNFWGLSNRCNVAASSTYRFSVAVKTENTLCTVIKVNWIDRSKNYLSQTDYLLLDDKQDSLDWHKYRATLKAPEGAKYGELRVLYKVAASGMAKVWVDDAAVELLPETPTKIMNGDFEQKALQYWDWDGEPDSVSVVKDFAKGSYIGESQRTSSQTSGDWWGLDYKVQVAGSSSYYFSANVKTENTNDAHIKIDWLDESEASISTAFIRGGLTGDNDWACYVGSVTAPETAKFAVLRFLQGVPAQSTTAKLCVDDLVFDQQTDQHESTKNGDFEDGNLNNWMTYGKNSASVITGSYKSGQYIGKSTINPEDSSTEEHGLGYLKKVAPGSIFKFSSALKTEKVQDAYIKIDWFDNAGNIIFTNDVSQKLQGDNDWTLFEDDYTAPLKSSYAIISFLHSKPANGTANIYADDMQFYPEPVQNGDFENNNLFNWEVSGNAEIVKGGYKIGNYIAVSERDAADTKAYWSGLNYYVAVDPTKKYEFSSAIRTENCREAHIKITWLDTNKIPLLKSGTTDQYLTDYLLKVPLNGDNDWQLVSQYFTPPTNASYAMISFCHENPKSGTGKLYIDNVYFREYTVEEITRHFKESGGKAKVLFTAAPSGAFGSAFPALDDKYAIELYDQNYVADSTNYYYSAPLDETNVLSYGVTYPDRLPITTEKNKLYENKNPTIDELKNYVNNGGGLLLNMGYTGYGDQAKVVENMNSFLKNLGAEIEWKKVTDDSHKEIYNYSAKYTYYSTSNIKQTDLTNNVSKIWYPGGKDTYSVTTYSIKPLDNTWTVDVKAEETALPKASDGAAPVLMAHRTYGKGRIVILTMDPRFGVASGSHEAYGNYILNDNAGDKQLYRNIYDWLGEPSVAQGRVFKKASTAPEVSSVSARKPSENIADTELTEKLNDSSNEMVNLNQYKGIIGVQSSLSGGTSSVEDLCDAAIAKEYRFLVFAEDYTKMDESKYNDLVSRCEAINKENSGFSAIAGLSLPPADKDIEPRYYGKGKRIVFNLKRWPTMEEATSPEWYILLFNQSWPSVIVSEPNLNVNSPWQLMFYTGIAIDTYDGNKQIDEASDVYRKLVSSDYRLIPVAVSYIHSVDELNAYNGAATYVYSKNVDEIKNNIQTFGGSGTSYSSTGPEIGFKYASATSATYAGSGEELFTSQKFALDISVNSTAELKEVTLYRDTEVYQKYYPQSTGFHKTIFLTKDANHAFTVEVTDANGKRAISNSVRTGSPYHNFTMCTDKQNVIHNFYGKEGSDGIIQSFWLSGKDLGQLYINKSASDIAPAGEDASWASASVVEGMPKVWTGNAKLGGDDPLVSTVSSRQNMLSTDDAVVVKSTIQDDAFQGYTQYTTFKPKLQGDNILMVEGNYTTKKKVTLGNSMNNLEMILFRVMGNYAHEPFQKYVYSPNYNVKIKGTMDKPVTIRQDAFLPVGTNFKLSEGGYLGMGTSKTGNIMILPLDTVEHDISFGLTTSRRVFEESGSETFRNYLAYGFSKPGTEIPANTPIKYKLLFVIDNGTAVNESHADEIRSAYRLGASQGMEAEITNGKMVDNKYILKVAAENNYAKIKLTKRYMPNAVLPVIVQNVQKNWDAVEYDYDTRQFRKLGGIDGNLYSADDVSSKDRNLFIGNPIVSTDSNLKINLLKDDNDEIKVEVHNPLKVSVTAKITNSPALKDIISLDFEGTLQPGESKELSVQMKSSYSFECNGPVDVAVNADVSADSSTEDSLPQKVIDGLNYTKWQSSNIDGQHWLQLDLGQEYKINRFIVKHAGTGGESSDLNTKDFTIQYQSKDSSEWINAVTVEGNTKNVTVHDINVIKARYVRIIVNKANSTKDNNSAIINAFEVYPTAVAVSKAVPQVIPKAPSITGISNGVVVESATPDWKTEEGMQSIGTISKDGGSPQTFSKATKIEEPGKYTLTVNAINPTNCLVSSTKMNFQIAKNASNIIKTITAFDELGSFGKLKNVANGTSYDSLKLPTFLNATVDGKAQTIGNITWSSNPDYKSTTSGAYAFTAVLPSCYTLTTGISAPVITLVVAEQSSNSKNHTNEGSSSNGASSTEITPSTITTTTNAKGGTCAVVTTKPDVASVVTRNHVAVSATVAADAMFVVTSATTEKPAEVEILSPTAEIVDQLKNSAVKTVDLTMKIPSAVVDNTNANVKVSINADFSVLQMAKDAQKDITFAVINSDTGKEVYSWMFSGVNLKNSVTSVTDVNLALSVTPVKDDVTASSVVANNTADNKASGIILKFNNSGLLPGSAKVKVYVGNQNGCTPNSKVFLYYLNSATRALEQMPQSEYTVDANGYVTVTITHGSNYVLLPKAATNPYPVKSDTYIPVGVKNGKTYTFGMTVSGKKIPSFAVGNGKTFTSTVKPIGNKYYFTVKAVGLAGTMTAVYSTLPGQKPVVVCYISVVK